VQLPRCSEVATIAISQYLLRSVTTLSATLNPEPCPRVSSLSANWTASWHAAADVSQLPVAQEGDTAQDDAPVGLWDIFKDASEDGWVRLGSWTTGSAAWVTYRVALCAITAHPCSGSPVFLSPVRMHRLHTWFFSI
jgi:hypothetical protein